MNKIYIALCTYNGERFLPRFLESLQRQTRPADTIIAYDDGSTDRTVSILEAFTAKMPLQIFAGNKNHGHRAAFNQALSLVQKNANPEDEIALADQDDEWLPDKLEILENALKHQSLVFGDARVIDAWGNEIDHSWRKFASLPQHVSLKSQIAGVNNVTGCLSLFRASLLESILPIPEGVTVHDRWIAMIAERHGGIHPIPNPVIKYRLHDSNAIGGKPIPKMSETLKLQKQWVKTILQNAHRIALEIEEIQFAETLLQLHRARETEAISLRFLPWIYRQRHQLFPSGSFKKRLQQILFSCIGLPLAKKVWGKS